MLITHDREKLIQAIIYFAGNTRFFGKIKMFKLLYFLDFEHYKVTGRSVTGLKYSAWKMGPVPTALFDELESPEPDFASAINLSEISTYNGLGRPMLSITSNIKFSNELFSRRELKLMQELVSEYRESKSDDMIEATHLENMPWDKVFNQQSSPQAEIPYEYALQINEREEMLKIIQERTELLEAIG